MTQQTYSLVLQSNYRWIKSKLCGDAAHKHSVDRKELFSQVLEKIWRCRHLFEPMPDVPLDASFRSWVNTMTYRLAIDIRRAQELRPFMIELEIMQAAAHSYEERIADADDADAILNRIHNVYGDVAYTAIRMLRSGMTVKECAALMRTSKDTIYRHIRIIKKDVQFLNL